MVAVNVTGVPTLAGDPEDVIVVVVDAALTVWLKACDVAEEKFASPEYTAVIE